MGVYFCGGFVYIAVDVSPVGDYEKLIILAIISRGDNAAETLMDKALRLLNLQKNISDYSSAY